MWRFIAAGVAAGILAAIGIALMMTPVYRAEVVSVFAETAPGGALARLGDQSSVLSALAGVGLPSGDIRDEALAVLRSKQFALELIEQEQLMPILFPNQWDSNEGKWRALPQNEIPSPLDAWQLF